MANNDTLYIHALRSIEGIGDGTLNRLLVHFGTGERVWLASDGAIDTLPKIAPERKRAIIDGRKTIDPEQAWHNLLALGITLHTKGDPTYPSLLRQIPDSPVTLYTRGTFDWTTPKPLIAIVGSRKHSPYGMQVAEKLAQDLTRAGIVVVSGMAFGIDSIAHIGALEERGETIAVLGSGVDDRSLTPVSHFQLAQKIMAHGALLSEYPPGTLPSKGSFPMRDRIIAGLCLGTIVIEAPEKSGSLITAQCALDYNREVFAVPGSILSPYSLGTNSLIKQGAKMVTSIQDILEELRPETLPLRQTNESMPEHLSSEEQLIWATLTHEPVHIDKIIHKTKLAPAEASALLSLLEIKGLAKNLGGMHYVKVAS
ncbi:MAG: DNA-processing protein DprA [Candidatus Moranbacteria bacterium]|nr:DNA-processing protein DprA [Candidatus Moranbacteria bacterium]